MASTSESIPAVEQLYSVAQIASLWQVSEAFVRRTFRHREGVIDLTRDPAAPVVNGRAGRNTIRIPASLVLDVMVERGYSRAQANRMLGLDRPL